MVFNIFLIYNGVERIDEHCLNVPFAAMVKYTITRKCVGAFDRLQSSK